MKRVLILEDKEIHRMTLIKMLKEIDESLEVYDAGTVAEAYKISMENMINLFLVDIIIEPEVRGDVSGLKFVEAIRKIPYYSFAPIIFITSLEDPEMCAYRELHCYGYIEKPFDKEEVKSLIYQALKFPQKDNNSINVYFRKDGVVYAIKKEEIIYIEISRKEILIHTEKENIKMPYMPVKQLLKELNSENFIQCNRGCIINKTFVEYIDYVNRYIKICDREEYVEIGRTMKEKVVNEFSN
ncbi:MAG: LytR/AlgR family response regulator transcription factor [Eubacterium sp.]